MSVVAAFALAGCAEPSPEPVSGSALPSPESVQQNAEDQSFKRNDGDYTANPKSSPSKPEKCIRGTDWPALKGRDEERPASGRMARIIRLNAISKAGGWARNFRAPTLPEAALGPIHNLRVLIATRGRMEMQMRTSHVHLWRVV